MSIPIRLPILNRPSSHDVPGIPPPPDASADEGEILMQIGDLAKESGKTVRAIHLYEELELLRPAARSKGRYRLYGKDALVRIRWIGKLQDMGFSLTDIQTIVRDWERSGSAPHAMVKMRAVYKKKLDETRAHLRRLVELEADIVASLEYLDACDVCEPDRLLDSCTRCDHHEPDAHVPELIVGMRSGGALPLAGGER